MAILSKQRTPKGYAEYWEFGRIELAPFAKTANITLFGFPDKTFAEEMGAIPMETVEFTVYPDHYDDYFLDGNTLENAYQLVTRSTIEGAVTYDFTESERING